jgi:protein phosphatase
MDASFAALTDVGQRREHNEDSILSDPPLFAVADGVGGSADGEVASQLAIETVAAGLTVPPESIDEQRTQLEHAIVHANTAVFNATQGGGAGRGGMSTTITAALVGSGGHVVIGHVGDSRAYRIRPGSVKADQLTQDHSMVAELVASGQINEAEARVHPRRNVVTRALGAEADVSVDTFVETFNDGDILLICSDGLTGHVSDEELAGAFGRAPVGSAALERVAQQLIDLANARGGTDNISVVLVAPVVSREPEPAAPDNWELPPDATGEISLQGFERKPSRRQRRKTRRSERTAEATKAQRIRTSIIALLAVIAAATTGAIAWSQSYFLLERSDGTVGVDQGFPVFGLSHPYQTSEVVADNLNSVEKERLQEGTLRSKENAQKALDELVRDAAPDTEAGE